MTLKLDVLVTTAHPDDAEASMSGTIIKYLAAGKTVGIADFTRGELGTRGTAEIRDSESLEATKRLDLTVRVNLGFRDGFFEANEEHVLKVVKLIRRFRPEVIFSNPVNDRHPDHGRANLIVREAAFLSGLAKIVTHDDDGEMQDVWRPKRIFHYIQSCNHKPDFIVDISSQWEKKCHVMRAYKTQFHCTDNEMDAPETPISRIGFWQDFEARARVTGSEIGAEFGEGFITEKALHISDVTALL